MRYVKFKIENYKGINSTEISFGESQRIPIVTLIGLNESGKTTILESINSFTYGRTDVSHLDIYGYKPPDPYDLLPIAQRSNFNDSVRMSAEIQLDAEDVRALREHLKEKFNLEVAEVQPRIVVSDNLKFRASSHDASKDKSRTWRLKLSAKKAKSKGKFRILPAGETEWQEAARFLGSRVPAIWYFPNFLFDLPARIYLNDKSTLEGQKAERNKFFRGFVQRVLSAVDPTATIDEHLSKRALDSDPRNKKSLESLCLKIGKHLSATVSRAWAQTVKSGNMARNIKFSIAIDEESVPYATLQIEESEGIFEISDRSLGFRWFFVFLLITHYVIAKDDESKNTILLLDEPASNLHPSAQQRLLQRFSELSAFVTLIYATHSHHLIDPARLESAYIIRNAGLSADEGDLDFKSSQTRIEATPYRKFVSESPDQSTYFQPVLDLLDVRPALLDQVSPMVMPEGKSDYFLLRLLLRVSGISDPPYAVYPGGGAGSLDNVIGLYTAWAREFVVLLDFDREGRSQKQRYIDRFSPEIAPRIILWSDVCVGEGVTGIESLLSPADRDALSVTAFGITEELSKKKILLAAQICLVEKRDPRFSGQLVNTIRSFDAKIRSRFGLEK